MSCAVQSDLDRMYSREDAAESKEKRIRAWLKNSGRVEDAILQAARSDGVFDEYVEKHDDGYAIKQLGLLAIQPCANFDTEYLMTLGNRVWKDFVAEQRGATIERLVDAEWNNWEDE
jgi:hypothetical protein